MFDIPKPPIWLYGAFLLLFEKLLPIIASCTSIFYHTSFVLPKIPKAHKKYRQNYDFLYFFCAFHLLLSLGFLCRYLHYSSLLMNNGHKIWHALKMTPRDQNAGLNVNRFKEKLEVRQVGTVLILIQPLSIIYF